MHRHQKNPLTPIRICQGKHQKEKFSQRTEEASCTSWPDGHDDMEVIGLARASSYQSLGQRLCTA